MSIKYTRITISICKIADTCVYTYDGLLGECVKLTRVQTVVNHKRISCCIDCHEFITYARTTMATRKMADTSVYNAILCLAIDILKYVFKRRRKTRDEDKQQPIISGYLANRNRRHVTTGVGRTKTPPPVFKLSRLSPSTSNLYTSYILFSVQYYSVFFSCTPYELDRTTICWVYR